MTDQHHSSSQEPSGSHQPEHQYEVESNLEDFQENDEGDLESFFQSVSDRNQDQTDESSESSADTYEVPVSDVPSASAQLSRTDARRLHHQRRSAFIRRLLIIFLAVIVVIGVLIGIQQIVGRHLQAQRNSATSVQQAEDWPGPGYGSVEFTVKKGESSSSIAQHLAKEGIIASASAFSGTVVSQGVESNLQPGTFTLKYRMSSAEVIKILTDPSKAKGMITVTSSARVSQVISDAAQLMKKPRSDFQAVINSHGQGILPAEANGSFEGWLQPDTYDPHQYTSAHDLLADMVRRRIAFLNEQKVPTGKQREEILIRASIIGGEVNKSEYYPQVSRVIQNRLDRNMSLGMDSVVAYGNNVQPSGLTTAMLQDSSNVYNVRIHKGLPPTPINQPDADMIHAAQHPAQGNWLYFVTVNLDTGETKFTDNEKQFEEYSREYHQWAAKNQ
jgi:UPF0755 protein